ncbi:MAG: hydroxymethylbilane synthase [Candidatus Hydrothermarchaeales archaeon]
MKLVIGTRGSKLALAQVDFVSMLLKERFPDLEFEKRIIKTTGDKISDAPLARIGGKGLFVKEIDEAVARGDVDFAVHSMKDVPTEVLEELEIACVPEREDARDVLISRDKLTLETLPRGAVIGTSSLRRKAEVLNYRGDLQVKDIRGNVDTRLRKLSSREYDAIIMAKAGLKRLDLEEVISQELPLDVFLPSIGQGAIAVVARRDFEGEYLSAINHIASMHRIQAERALLKRLGGGCQVPIGAMTQINGKLFLTAAVFSPNGDRKIEAIADGKAEDAEEIGVTAAEELLRKGADEILEEVYG